MFTYLDHSYTHELSPFSFHRVTWSKCMDSSNDRVGSWLIGYILCLGIKGLG